METPNQTMTTIDKVDLETVANVIRNGGLVVFPSDTVYILAVDPTNQEATNKLLAFKNRWAGKAISIAVADQKMAEEFVLLNENSRSIYSNLLPGPFTVVSEGKHKVAKGIEAENGTLGIRIPNNEWIFELVRAVGGPVTATSANLSGRTPHYSVDSFIKTLSKKKTDMIDLFVDAGKLPRNKPSTVIDATMPEIKILRRGDLITGTNKTLISKSEKETEKVAQFLLKKAMESSENSEGKAIVFGLSGDLGCGKTVFSRKIGHLLGVVEKITSPTFVIYNEYKINLQSANFNYDVNKFVHFDLYRMGNKYEFEEINFLEQFGPGTVACVEWVENMGDEYMEKLKKLTRYIPVNFSYVDQETREIRI